MTVNDFLNEGLFGTILTKKYTDPTINDTDIIKAIKDSKEIVKRNLKEEYKDYTKFLKENNKNIKPGYHNIIFYNTDCNNEDEYGYNDQYIVKICNEELIKKEYNKNFKNKDGFEKYYFYITWKYGTIELVVDTNVKIINKTGKVVENTMQKTDWIEKINELSIDEEVVDEFFKYKKMKIDPDFDRQEVIDFAYAEFDKLINGKYSDYDYAVIRDNDIKYRNKFLNNNKREYTCLYKINADMTGDTSTTVMTSTNGDTTIGTTASGISEYSQKILSIVNKIISEVNLKLFEKYGSFTKKGKIFNKDGYDVPYYYLDVLYWDEISLCVNRQKVKINKKTGEIVDK